MKQRLFTKTAMASALAAACLSAHALGLGELSVASNLNQRFTGSIPLSEINSEDLETVTVTLAPPDAYDRAGLERSDFLNSLRFDVRNEGGNPRVVVSSTQIAREPMVNVLVQARWKAGKIIREYSVLLDPPDLPRLTSAPVIQPAAPTLPPPVALPRPVAPTPLVAASLASASPANLPSLPPLEVSELKAAESEFFEVSVTTGQPALGKSDSAPAPVAPVAITGETYGPIKPQETLWRVATNIRPNSKVSMEQVMLALVDANPGTIQRGITLSTGSLLKLPTVESMLRLSRAQSKARWEAIQAGRVRGASATAAATGAPSMPVAASAKPLAAPIAVPALPTAQSAAPVRTPVVITPSPVAGTVSAQPGPADASIAPAAPQTSDGPPVVPAPPAEGALAAARTPPPAAPVAAPPVVIEPFAEDEPGSDWPSYWPVAAGGGLALLFGLMALRRVRRQPGPTPDRYPSQPAAASLTRPTAPRTTARAAVVTPLTANRSGDTQITTVHALAADQAPVATAPSSIAAAALVTAPPGSDLTPAASLSHEGGNGLEHVADTAPAVAKAKADPLADADFHLAYGLFDEAEEVLTKAIALEPARDDLKLKLAETYFAADKADAFQRITAGMKERIAAADWAKIAIMGSQLLPTNGLYQSGAGIGESTDFDLTLDRLPADQNKPLGALSSDFAATVPPPNSLTGMPNLARDLSDDIFAEVAQASRAAPVPTISMSSALDTPSGDADAIDFMLGQSIVPLGANQLASTPATPVRGLNKPLEFNLGGTALNVDSPIRPLTLSADEIDSFEISLQSWQVSLTPREQAPVGEDEMNTKLDLARAYVEMGDKDSARSLLKEVVEHGAPQHQGEAQALLERLGGE
jgi:pilus assembly protein FimV